MNSHPFASGVSKSHRCSNGSAEYTNIRQLGNMSPTHLTLLHDKTDIMYDTYQCYCNLTPPLSMSCIEADASALEAGAMLTQIMQTRESNILSSHVSSFPRETRSGGPLSKCAWLSSALERISSNSMPGHALHLLIA